MKNCQKYLIIRYIDFQDIRSQIQLRAIQITVE